MDHQLSSESEDAHFIGWSLEAEGDNGVIFAFAMARLKVNGELTIVNQSFTIDHQTQNADRVISSIRRLGGV